MCTISIHRICFLWQEKKWLTHIHLSLSANKFWQTVISQRGETLTPLVWHTLMWTIFDIHASFHMNKFWYALTYHLVWTSFYKLTYHWLWTNSNTLRCHSVTHSSITQCEQSVTHSTVTQCEQAVTHSTVSQCEQAQTHSTVSQCEQAQTHSTVTQWHTNLSVVVITKSNSQMNFSLFRHLPTLLPSSKTKVNFSLFRHLKCQKRIIQIQLVVWVNKKHIYTSSCKQSVNCF